MKAILIDDEQQAINRLTSLIKSVKEIEIIGSYTDPELALKKFENVNPELVFTDVEMPEMSGFELVKEIKNLGYTPKFIFVTAFDHYAIKAIKEQAFDYLLKPVDIDELKATLRRFFIHQKLPIERIHSFSNQFDLSKRETEILECMVTGETSQHIADKFFLSKHTVDTHRRNILGKIGSKNTAELIIRLSVS